MNIKAVALAFLAHALVFTGLALANERFGLTPEEADAKWKARLGQSEGTKLAGVDVVARKYAIGGWLMTVVFIEGKSEALEYQKKGDGGRSIAPDEKEIEAILRLFGLYIASETRVIYRVDPDVREWQGPQVRAFYDPRELTIRVFSLRGLEAINAAQERMAKEGVKGL